MLLLTKQTPLELLTPVLVHQFWPYFAYFLATRQQTIPNEVMIVTLHSHSTIIPHWHHWFCFPVDLTGCEPITNALSHTTEQEHRPQLRTNVISYSHSSCTPTTWTKPSVHSNGWPCTANYLCCPIDFVSPRWRDRCWPWSLDAGLSLK